MLRQLKGLNITVYTRKKQYTPLFKRLSNPFSLSSDNAATLQDFAGRDIELEKMRDGGKNDVKPSTEFGKISNQAIDRYADK